MGIITSQIAISGSESSSISISNLPSASSLTNILVYDSASGQLTYTSSAAVGGGGGGSYLPLAGGTMDSGSAISFINGARLRQGITDAGLGGAGGIALKCSIDYELKWDAGRLYVMDDDGFTIRQSLYNFNIAPTVDDDELAGYVIGSRWTLDNGITYKCIDATEGAAVWRVESGEYIPGLTLSTNVSVGGNTTAVFSVNGNIMTIGIRILQVTIDFDSTSNALITFELPIGYAAADTAGSISVKYTSAPIGVATPVYSHGSYAGAGEVAIDLQNYGGVINDVYDISATFVINLQ
jgi:hypothetical protein